MNLNYQKLLDAEEVAKILGVKKNTIRAWRAKKIGPPFIKILKTIRYRREDVEDFLRKKAMESRKCSIRSH